ncbi:MAG: CHAP domain-containing protein [Rhodospirillales bacterium]|nr:CHAP domain-containing protein [Rhodospirillales bacterium]
MSLLSFCKAARVWLAGASVLAVSVLVPACAKASTHHTEHHVAVRHTALHVPVRHEYAVHHVLPAHRLASTGHYKHYAASHYRHYAAERHERYAATHYKHYAASHYRHYAAVHYTHQQRVAAEFRHSRLQCVPYAREVSHIDLSGNAFLWWAEAAGRYARGNTPQIGAVLNFRSIGRMPLGHVAVVTAVIDPRTILVTQANWVPGSITNDVTVQDISADNDWTDVRVELGDTSAMGSAYPTYGFIYAHPDSGTVIASNGGRNEVAEAPVARPVASEAPDRNLQ